MLKATFTQTAPEAIMTTTMAGALANLDPFNPACQSIEAALYRRGTGHFTDMVSKAGPAIFTAYRLSKVSCG